jgi:hypothetical protein
MEVWKDIKGYEGLYQVSNFGRVKSLSNGRARKEKMRKISVRSGGYLYVGLYKNNKGQKFSVHRLVAEAFVPNPNKLNEVNHKDENATNNCADNLEWCTRSYNNNYGTRNERAAKSRSKPVVCVELGEVYSGAEDAARKLRLHGSHIIACCDGERKTTGGYHWRYKETEGATWKH